LPGLADADHRDGCGVLLCRQHGLDQRAQRKDPGPGDEPARDAAGLLLGQARGAAIASLVSGGLPMVEFSALEVKKAIVGSGRASKSQVQEMVKRLLKLNKVAGTDASDALAVAICAAHHRELNERLQQFR
ncbi:MAG: hypothetical protein RIR85_816, partial [Pseudomonadota bacterium]